MILDIDAEGSTNSPKPTDSAILADVYGINNVVLSDNNQDDENRKDIRAAVQMCSRLAIVIS